MVALERSGSAWWTLEMRFCLQTKKVAQTIVSFLLQNGQPGKAQTVDAQSADCSLEPACKLRFDAVMRCSRALSSGFKY